MSRDPEDGFLDLPPTLHKYLYASADPVNRIDPSGRDEFIDDEIAFNEDKKIAEEIAKNKFNDLGVC